MDYKSGCSSEGRRELWQGLLCRGWEDKCVDYKVGCEENREIVKYDLESLREIDFERGVMWIQRWWWEEGEESGGLKKLVN